VLRVRQRETLAENAHLEKPKQTPVDSMVGVFSLLVVLAVFRGSSDGQTASRIAFASQREGNFELYTMKPDGSDVRRLTDNPASDLQPAWSPDGQRIAFTSNRSGNSDIWVMDADGTHALRLGSTEK
jgi:dipeptidyl aminopeptidase/acylaminoacyl peptidase